VHVNFRNYNATASLAESVLDDDAAHGLACSSEEMATGVPVLFAFLANQSQIGFVDESRSLQRLAVFLLSQLLGSKLAQFVINQRQELLAGVRLTALDGGQDSGHVIQRLPPKARKSRASLKVKRGRS
jgi:hypothetical protein